MNATHRARRPDTVRGAARASCALRNNIRALKRVLTTRSHATTDRSTTSSSSNSASTRQRRGILNSRAEVSRAPPHRRTGITCTRCTRSDSIFLLARPHANRSSLTHLPPRTNTPHKYTDAKLVPSGGVWRVVHICERARTL